MALSNRVISVTEESYVPASIDGILNSNVFYSRLFMRENKNWSGRQIQIPLQFAKPTTGGSFSGVGDFDTSLQDTRTRQTFEHAQFYQNVSIAGGEASLNKTDAEVLDLVKITMEEAQNAALDSLGDQLYDTGAGNDILGLGAIVDAGANTSTYAGLSRTTYPQLNATVQAATGGVLDFTLMATVMRGASAASSKRQRPSIILSDETTWDLLESKYTPTTQATYDAISHAQLTTYSKPGMTMEGGKSLGEGQMGFECLRWRGIPVVADEKCDTGTMFFINEEYLHWYNLRGIDLQQYKVASASVDSVYSEYQKTYPIQWSGFQKPYNQYARIGQFIALGNVISGSTRRMGKATSITTT
jgi:hypothetical protein